MSDGKLPAIEDDPEFWQETDAMYRLLESHQGCFDEGHAYGRCSVQFLQLALVLAALRLARAIEEFHA